MESLVRGGTHSTLSPSVDPHDLTKGKCMYAQCHLLRRDFPIPISPSLTYWKRQSLIEPNFRFAFPSLHSPTHSCSLTISNRSIQHFSSNFTLNNHAIRIQLSSQLHWADCTCWMTSSCVVFCNPGNCEVFAVLTHSLIRSTPTQSHLLINAEVTSGQDGRTTIELFSLAVSH